MSSPRAYHFGPFRLDVVRRRLERGDEVLALSGRPFDLLVALVEGRDRVLGREELLQRVWPGVIVEEANLTQNVSVLRKLLDEDPNDHRFIVTVAGRGYRFVAPTVEVDDIAEQSPTSDSAAADSRSADRRTAGWRSSRVGLIAAVVAAFLLGGIVLGGLAIRRPAAPARQPGLIAVLPIQTAGLARPADERGMALADEVIRELTARGLAVVPTRAILEFADPARDTPQQAGRALGAEVVVVATVRDVDGRWEGSLQFVDPDTGNVLVARRVEVEGAPDADRLLALAFARAIAEEGLAPLDR